MYPNNYYAQQQITQVTGENGARMINLAPNSSILLLDNTAPLVWLVQTDGAGYKTCTPYNITPYQPAPEPSLTDIIDRLSKVEEKLNVKSNTKPAKQQPNE